MNYPKILVGAPVSSHHEYCTEKFIQGLLSLDYPNYDILLIDNSDNDEFYNKFKDKIPMVRDGYNLTGIKKRMVYCRNMLRTKALLEGYEYFFNVDQDVIPPKDTLKRFLSDKKMVLTGIYYNYFTINGKERKLPLLYGWFSEIQQKEIMSNLKNIEKKQPSFYNTLKKNNFNFNNIRRHLSAEEVEEDKLIEIKMCGSGCLFIHREVLEKIEFRENTMGGFDDVIFCMDVREKLKMKIWCDTYVKCDHKVNERPWNWATDGKENYILKKS